jgi:hypothetical protein
LVQRAGCVWRLLQCTANLAGRTSQHGVNHSHTGHIMDIPLL